MSLTFILKQHTPIIHFQYDQEDATLRATEVKPKLDAFLNKKLTIRKEWLLKDDTRALDYKLRIQILEKQHANVRTGQIKIFPPVEKQWLHDKFLELSVFSFHETLLAELERLIPEFFALHNFGNRQNKGWGSFSAGRTRQEAEDYKLFREVLVNSGRIVFQKKDEKIQGKTLDLIKNDWQRLKTGINSPYEKSLLFEYMCIEKGIRWEKRHFKKSISNEVGKGPLKDVLFRKKPPIDLGAGQLNNKFTFINSYNDSGDNYQYRYVRAMLGLAKHYEFLVGTGNDHTTENIKVKYKVTVDGGDIERFKAPVTFKVFNRQIFLLVEEIKNMYDVRFDFKLVKKTKDGGPWRDEHTNVQIDHLMTPSREEFNLEDFIDWACTQIDYQKLRKV